MLHDSPFNTDHWNKRQRHPYVYAQKGMCNKERGKH